MSPYLVSLIMFSSLLVLIIVGIPIAFATAIIGLVCAYTLWAEASIFIVLTSISGVMSNWVLVAVPLFVFMAILLNGLGVVADLYEAIYKWSGPVSGGLAVATILVGTVMGAMTGLVAGVVVALALIALPQMLRYNYDKTIPLGAVMAGGSQAQLVPPSIILVVYGAMTLTSVGCLFASGICCGLLFAILYCIYILTRARLNKDLCPTLPPQDRATWREKFVSLRLVILPAFLIVFVLGAILTGTATPTEGSAVGCVGALICGVVNRRLRWSVIREAASETLKISTMILWIAMGSTCFGAVFTGIGGHALIIQLAEVLPMGAWGVFAAMMFMLFILGCFMDQTAIIFICAPMFAKAASSLGFDPIWFGMVFLLFMIVGFLTPPFGYALFYVRGVAPEGISIGDIYKSAVPFIGLQIIGIALVIIFPQIAVWLPHMLFAK